MVPNSLKNNELNAILDLKFWSRVGTRLEI